MSRAGRQRRARAARERRRQRRRKRPATRAGGGVGWRPGPAWRRSGEVAAASGGGQGPPRLQGRAAARGLRARSAQTPLPELERPGRWPHPVRAAGGAYLAAARQRQAPDSAARVPSAGCGSHNMATAVAGGAAAPGAERGREPGWRRDLAEAAGGEGGRKATPAWAPARAVRLRSCCPGPARPRAFRLRRARPWRRRRRGGAGRGRRYTRAGPGPRPGLAPVALRAASHPGLERPARGLSGPPGPSEP